VVAALAAFVVLQSEHRFSRSRQRSIFGAAENLGIRRPGKPFQGALDRPCKRRARSSHGLRGHERPRVLIELGSAGQERDWLAAAIAHIESRAAAPNEQPSSSSSTASSTST